MSKLTPAQARVSSCWPKEARFHCVKVRSYRESRVVFEAARKLGFRATWSGDLMILRKPSGNPVTDTIEAGVDRFLRGLRPYWAKDQSPEDLGHKRSVLRRYAPQALPCFDLIVSQAYV